MNAIHQSITVRLGQLTNTDGYQDRTRRYREMEMSQKTGAKWGK